MSSIRQLRKEVYYSGSVQGVGFRYTTRLVASDFDVTGFVENLSDGRVHLVVEGKPAEIRRFLNEIDHQLGAYIRDRKVSDLAPSGEFTNFSIRA